MSAHDKANKHEMRKLADLVWERDAARTLAILDRQFIEWRAGAISHGELLDAIHRFHQQEARSLWSRYQGGTPEWHIKVGLVQGLIGLDDLPEQLRTAFGGIVQGMSNMGVDHAADVRQG